ncbi:MAG TPA: DUF6797 domain-containing protein [Verrucomicrobiae bacterium]|nr:DUF6797 domain-containing protein [Verrucomicrobiae bacterium]
MRPTLIAFCFLLAAAHASTNRQILPAHPGLDGGTGGHWGKQAEPDWRDSRWNQTDVGPFMSSLLPLKNGTVLKSMSVRVGDAGEGTVCFDTASATLRAGWTGGFLNFDPARYGIILPPKPTGKIQFLAPAAGAWGDAKIEHRGFYLNGRRVVWSYTVNGTPVLDSLWMRSNQFTRALQIDHRVGERPREPLLPEGVVRTHDIDLRPAPKTIWPETFTVQGQLAPNSSAYVIDTIPVPYDNPYKALMFLTGVDFFDNGDAAVCTLHGDVWLVRGIDDQLKKVTWKRYATGLFQPLGLKIRTNIVHVLGRDQITALHDRNGDDEADYYENAYNGIRTSSDGHDYVTSLEMDAEGNFYYVDPRGAHWVSADGKRTEILATGFRNPNGMSVGPHGEITVAPQEGEWTPATMICEIQRGGHYGYGGPRPPRGVDRPLCYVPRWIDNSSGSQIWGNSDRWGPLQDQLINLSFGRCSMMLVLRQKTANGLQAAVVPLPGRFLSGAVRAAFRKQDGQLYVVGTRGWTSSALRDGSFQRVRYTGKNAYIPIVFEARKDGIRLKFTQPLTRETAEDTGSYSIEQWNYKYSKEYGSKEYSALSPDLVGHDPVDIQSAKLEDPQTIFLRIPTLRPVHHMWIKYNLTATDGQQLRGELYPTIHWLEGTESAALSP